MKHLAFTAEEFRKNVVRQNKSGIPLRGTKTSEISAFVKNCNLAEATQLKKELNLWHKDTGFNVRKLNRKTEILYKSLLKISTAKKKIKSDRQNKIEDKKNEENWKSSDRRYRRKANAFTRNLELNLIQISEENEIAEEEKADLMTNGLELTWKKNKSDSKDISKSGNLNDDKKLKNYNFCFDNFEKKQINKENMNFLTDLENRNEDKLKENFSNISLNEMSSLNQNLQHKKSNASTKKNCLKNNFLHFNVLKEDENNAKDINLQQIHLYKNVDKSSSQQLSSDIEREIQGFTIDNYIDEKSLNEKDIQLRHAESDDKDLENFFETFGKVNSNFTKKIDQKLLSPKTDIEFKSLEHSNKRIGKNILQTNNKVNPSIALNMNSSIKTRPGHVYNVAVYKKNTKGNLEKEVLPLDTTIDVYKHFKIASYKERLHRKQLLIEAHNIEAMQRHRVNNFIKKLDREDELTREAEANTKKRAEEMELLQRHLEARNRAPPKYGPGGYNNAPNYLRMYTKPQSHAFVRKRSSWAIPSLYTLQLAESSEKQLYSKQNSSLGSNSFNVPGFAPSSGASHLVNINTAKYYQGVKQTVAA